MKGRSEKIFFHISTHIKILNFFDTRVRAKISPVPVV
jgi:hypothetical protein